jgi:primosomal protein N' (replication factor Y)
LDLPRLSVVGVITADTGLSFPDYTAQERLYQLTSQVIGRVGRGHRHGQAIVQTYSPDNPILMAAINKDWPRFYDKELAERAQFIYPPFCHILKLTCRRSGTQAAQKSATEFAERLRQLRIRIDINGPAPSFYEKQNSKFGWQIIIKAKRRQELLNVISLLPSGWSYDIDPVNLL